MKQKPLSLALQGGGAHGAFTWGVIDRLLEDGRVDIGAITATSAGAMNAVALAQGWLENGADGARQSLEEFWLEISRRSNPIGGPSAMSLSFGPFTPYAFFQALTNIASPYDLNPFDFNPLRETLERRIDFERLRENCDIKLFIAATNVETGKARVFKTPEINVDAILASACLPQAFKAVQLGNQAYWDGGYVGNPALFPLFYADVPKDMLIVHINPLYRDGVPKTAAAIQDRLNEITFNASLVSELRSIAFVQKLLDENWLADRVKSKYRRLHVHAIRADKELSDFAIDSKFDTSWTFLTDLRDRGRRAATLWLGNSFSKVGKASSIDIRAEFLDGVED